MKYGLSDSEYAFLQEHLIAPLKARGARVFVFGSRVTGKHKKFSGPYRTDTLHFIPETSFTLLQNQKGHLRVQL